MTSLTLYIESYSISMMLEANVLLRGSRAAMKGAMLGGWVNDTERGAKLWHVSCHRGT